MGYGVGTLNLVCRHLPLGGSIVELGAQSFHGKNENRGPTREWFANRGYIYECLDIRGDPPFDLNSDEWDHGWQADVVTNFGTTEHVMDQYNAFDVIHSACKDGGVMIHEVPHLRSDHGMFNYNERFFNYLAEANGYDLVECRIPDARHVIAVLEKCGDQPFQPAMDMSTR